MKYKLRLVSGFIIALVRSDPSGSIAKAYDAGSFGHKIAILNYTPIMISSY